MTGEDSMGVQVEENEKEEKPTVKSVVTRFQESTTAHGIPHVHNAVGLAKTIFWTIISLAATVGFGYNSYLLIEDYIAFNTTTSISLETKGTMKLPAITFCNYNPVVNTKLLNNAELSAILSSFSSGRKKETPKEIVDTIADLSLTSKYAMGHQLEDLIVQCKYNGYSCNLTADFYAYYDPTFGNCYTYNSGKDGATVIQSTRSGATHGLSIVFNTNQAEYVGFLTETAGMRISIHPQPEMPFPVDEGISCSPGELTNIGIRKVSIARMGDPYGDCLPSSTVDYSTNVFAEIYGVSYNRKACELTCYQKHVTKECGCGDPKYPLRGQAFVGSGTYPSCKSSNTTQETCMSNVETQWTTGNLGCSCYDPCNEDMYAKSISAGMWPSDNYKNELFGQLANTTLLQALYNSNDTDEYKRNLGKINIFFEEFNFELLQQDIAYELFSLISDLGGILGLYIGFSAMTILEFLELAVDLSIVGFMTWRSKKDGMGTSTPVNTIY